MGFHLYWLARTNNKRDMRVLIAIHKDIVSKVIVENWTDFASYLYCMILDFKEPYQKLGKMPRKTRVLNLYNNKLGEGYL